MSELARRLNQCKKPVGDQGKLVVEDMNESHYKLTGWGLDKVNILEDSTVLDIGCGGGRTVNRLVSLANKGKVCGIDYSSDCVRWASDYNKKLIEEGRVLIKEASVEKLPFEDNKFDFVTAVETIYFWPHLKENIKEVRRVLKKGGKFIIINEIYDDVKFKERNEEFIKNSDMKIYSKDELKDFLKDAGYLNIHMEVKEENNWICYVGEK
ncbi:class I SAM-dependent methyltransferase [Clostridium felsineum]|uniref:class I SAM-dependent methyltransferase n=1 Tax=Clostridium felsineum TaxID=36839 RepID=UPI00098CDC36|nr:class I SAM-dependent methyltransferase [Clostridium felsineum]URZ17761.1 2-methoxy-6-polyprenyl-1,4-benzoquinol methylase, mitochondrial [Clostridium felsineum DSM 794]